MPATPTTGVVIEVDICGAAPQAQTSLQFTSTSTNVSNLTERFTSTGTLTSSVYGNLVTNTVSCNINQSTRGEVLQAVFTADPGYFISSMPSFVIMSGNSKKWSSTAADKIYDSNNNLISVTFNFYHDIGTQNVDSSSGENIIWTVPEAEAHPVSCVSIHSAYLVGLPNQSILPSGRQVLKLCVSGSENSTYNIKVQTDNGKTYDFTLGDGTFSRELTVSATQTIYPRGEQVFRGRTPGKNTHDIIIPYANLKCDTDSQTYTITVTPMGSTFSDVGCTATDPIIIILNQFGLVTTSIQTNVSEDGVGAISSSIKRLTDQDPLSYPTSFDPKEFPRLNTSNNGYFTYSSKFSFVAKVTVSSHTHASTSVVLDGASAALNLRTGDGVTGVGVDTGTTITVDGSTTIVLSKTSVATITGPLVFTRTVGISRQPQVNDFYTLDPAEAKVYSPGYNLTTSCIVVENVSNSTFVKLDTTDNLNPDIGFLAQGDTIVGYPTITSVSSDGVVLSTNQTLLAGEELIFSNKGVELNISEINVTGAGTSTCTLNIDGYIRRVGKGDVDVFIDLSKFTTTYASPTSAAVAVTATLCETIIIEPLTTCTSTTDNLIIRTVSVTGDGTAVISNDQQSITYTAPDSGTSDTINYTVGDGLVSSSSSAITITLTSY
tara:strand:+ start:13 stop:1995 length:1983 start_codon:yes stop_codon:yes gene_type:complete